MGAWKVSKLFPVFVLALFLTPTHSLLSSGTTRYVNKTDATCLGQSPCYTTIQAAITAVQSGDTVRIQAGLYEENILIPGKNSANIATESDRITIESDPSAALGSVVLGSTDQGCTDGDAITIESSKFITLRGLTITATGGQSLVLASGAKKNKAIHLERNRIVGNLAKQCEGGVTIGAGNTNTLIVNNLIYGNGQHGLKFKTGKGTHTVVGNTIHGNGRTGIILGKKQEMLLVNNLITGNGADPRSPAKYRTGISRTAAKKKPLSEQVQLLNNLICGNTGGELSGAMLDGTDTGNLTPTGSEGPVPQVSASPGCNLTGNIYANVNGTDGQAGTGDDDFTLAPNSPAIDSGADPRALALGVPNTVLEADFLGDARRPQDGDGNSSAVFDRGAVEKPAGPPPNRPPNAVDDSATTAANTATQISVLANDTDPDHDSLTVSSFTQGAQGGVSFAQNVATYTPNTGFSGIDTFTYTIGDGRGGSDTATVTVTVTPPACAPPTITGISPLHGTVGAEITITGTNLNCGTMRTLTCGGVALSITSVSPTQIKAIIPPGAADCRVSFTTDGGAITVPPEFAFDVELSRDFSLTINPATLSVLPGSSALYRVSADGPDNFTDLITLGVSGLPAGVTGSFFPSVITAGRSATLTIEAANTAAQTTETLTVTGSARIDGTDVPHSASAAVTVLAGGRTALVGQVKLTNGPPLTGVRLIFANLQGQPTQTTDSGGNFQFVDLPAGEHTMTVDATAGSPAEAFSFNEPLPMYGVSVTLTAGQTLELPPLQICPQPKPEQFTPLQNQTQNQVIADPRFPDATFMVPAGTTITGWDGIPKTKMGMEKLSPDQLPVPPPPGPTRSLYQPFFGTPMGGVPSEPIPVTFPNDLDLKPGEKADLWYYDAAPFPGVPGDWRLAGSGTVSADGSKIISDEKLGDGIGDDDGVCETGEKCVGIERFCGVCGLSCFIPRQQGQPNNNPDSPTGGDPVNLALGQMIVEKTDMVLPGRIPAVVQRTYNPFDPFGGIAGFQLSLGPGWGLSVELVLQTETSSLRRLIMPGNARFAFVQQPDGTFVNSTHPQFAGAVLTQNGSDHSLRLKDGTLWRFVPGPVGGISLLVEQVDRNNNRLTIERNSSGRVTRLIEPAGRELVFTLSGNRISEITDPLGRVVRYAYNGAGRLETVTDPTGGVTRYTYDSAGRVLTITDPRSITYLTNQYDANGRVIRQTQADGGVWTFQYLGLIGAPTGVVTTDPRANATTQRFSPTGFASETIDALGQVTRFERDAAGQVTAITDPLGRVTRFEYDAVGNVTKITDPAGSIRGFEYETTFNRLTKLTDPLGNTSRFNYDARGNLIKLTDPLGHMTQIAYNTSGQPVSTTDPLGNVTAFVYDPQGNLATVTDPLGNASGRVYDLVSRLITQTDPRGRTTDFAYDELSRLAQVVDALTGVTEFTYDGNGNLLTVSDALNHTTTYTYDNMDRLNRRIDPVGANESFDYDELGNLIRHTDRKQQVSTFSYDPLNRRVGAAYADSSTSFVYDTVGRLVQATDSVGGTILNEYDVLDRLIAQTTGLGTIQYAYDALNRRSSMSAPGQPLVSYSYDTNSRLVQITQGSQIVDFDYDASGRRTRLTLPNRVSTEYRYDTASRLAELTNTNTSTNTLLGNLTYTYDPAGNRTQVGGSFARTLLPDPITSASYDPANRQLQFGDKTMDFDPNGNLTSITDPSGFRAFTWDSRNRLMAVDGPAVVARFNHDPFGRRNRKEINGETTGLLYDTDDILQEEHNGLGEATYLRNSSTNEVLSQTINGSEMRYYLVDAINSTLSLTDATGNSVVHYSYEPFGRPEASGPSTSNPFQFAGFENDNTGLYYYHTRYQDPELQRFVAEEPSGLGSVGVNEYVYVSNNPLISPAPTRDYAVTALPSVTRGTLLPSVNESTKPLIEAAVRIVLAIITNGASEGAFEVKEFYEIADEIADAVVAWKPVLLDLMNMKKGRPPKTWGGINYRIYTGKCDSSDLDCVLGGQSQ